MTSPSGGNIKKVLISVALYVELYNSDNFNRCVDGMLYLLKIASQINNIYIRVHHNGLEGTNMLEMLQNNSKIHLVGYNSTPDKVNIGKLLRYLPLFDDNPFSEYDAKYAYVLVLDLELPRSVIEEYVNYIPYMAMTNFAYNYNRQYMTDKHWYNTMMKETVVINAYSHLVNGSGIGFVPGILGDKGLLYEFIYELNKTHTETKCPIISRFRELNREALALPQSKYNRSYTWMFFDNFHKDSIELFLTFYLMPVILKSNLSVMQIPVQFHLLKGFALDLYSNVPTRNELFVDGIGIDFDQTLNVICGDNKYKGDHKYIQYIWTELLRFTRKLYKEKHDIDNGLLTFLEGNQDILTEKNNKRLMTDPYKLALLRKLTIRSVSNHFD
jgi:hypothetical protein